MFALEHLETAEFLKALQGYGVYYLGWDADFHYLFTRYDDTIFATPRKDLADETMLAAVKAKVQREKKEPLRQFPYLTRSKEWLEWRDNANLIKPERE